MEGDEHGVAQREWNDSEGIAIQRCERALVRRCVTVADHSHDDRRHPLHAPHEVQGNPMGVQPRINIPAPVYRQKMRIMPILEQLGIDAPIPIFYPTIPPAPHVENQISTHFITYYVAQRRVGRSPADVFRGLILESLNTRLLPLAEDSLPLNDRNVEEFIVRLRRLEEDRVDFVQRMVQDTQRSANAVAGPSNAGNSNQQPTAVPFHSHSPAYPPHAPPLASTQIHQRPAEHPNQQAPKAHHSRFPHVYAPRPPLPPHLTPAQPTTSAPFLPLPTPPSSVLQLPFNSNPLPYSRVPSHSPQNVRPGQLTPDQSPAEPRQAKRPIGTTREASELSVGAREMIDLTLDDDQGEDRLAEGSGAKRPRTTANPDLPPIVPVSTAMAFGASITSRPSAPANLLSPATLLPPAPMRRENWTIPKGLEIPLRSRNTGSASRLPTPPFSVSPEIRPLEFPRLLPAHHPPPPPQASDFMASFQSAPQQPLSRTAKPLAAPPAIVPRRPKPSRTALPPAAPPAIVPRGPKPTAEQKQQVRRLEEVVTQARINDLMVSSPVEADRQQKLFDSALAYRSREELGWKMKSGRNSPTATTKKGESAADAEKRQEVQRLAKLEREAGKLAARARSDAVKERVRLECIEAE